MDTYTEFELFQKYKENKKYMEEVIARHYNLGSRVGFPVDLLDREILSTRERIKVRSRRYTMEEE